MSIFPLGLPNDCQFSFSDWPNTAEVMGFLRQGSDDHDIKRRVAAVNRECTRLFGLKFRWGFDPDITGKDLGDRVFLWTAVEADPFGAL